MKQSCGTTTTEDLKQSASEDRAYDTEHVKAYEEFQKQAIHQKPKETQDENLMIINKMKSKTFLIKKVLEKGYEKLIEKEVCSFLF